MPYDVSFPMALPVIIVGVLLVVYCLVDIARTDEDLLIRKWQWALAVLVLVPLGPIAYLLIEKVGMLHSGDSVAEIAAKNLHPPEH